MKKIFICALLFTLLSAACASAAPKRVALLMSGVDESVQGSYNAECAEGLRNVKARFGSKRLVVTTANVLDDAARVRETLLEAAKNSDLVILASDDYLKYVPDAVAASPNCVLFSIVGGDELPSLRRVEFRDEEGGFLAGALAAMVTVSDKIINTNPEATVGVVLGEKIHATQRFARGFEAGALYIDPKTKVLQLYTGSFTDASKAAAAADRMYSQGADVIFCASGVSARGAAESARKKHYWVIGADSEMEEKYPDSVLTSVVKRSGHLVYGIVENFMRRPLPEGNWSVGMKENCIDLSIWTRAAKLNIPISVRKRISEIADKLENGLIVINRREFESLKN